MKYILFVSILILFQLTISLVQSQRCYTCLKEGDKCIASSNATQKCPTGTGCYNTSIDYECYRLPTVVGASCSISDRRCGEGLLCNNNNDTYTCEEIQFKGYGESCSDDEQCSRDLTCSQGTCINLEYPNCTHDSGCKGINEFCSTPKDICLTKFQDGEKCLSMAECKFGSNCLPRLTSDLDSICKKQGTLIEGEKCEYSIDCDLSLGFVCSHKNYTCVKFSSYTNKTCDDTGRLSQACPHLTSCSCDTSSPFNATCQPNVDINLKTQNFYFDWVDCVVNSGCSWVYYLRPSSCLSKCGPNPFDVLEFNPCGKLVTGDASNTFISTYIFGFILLISLLI